MRWIDGVESDLRMLVIKVGKVNDRLRWNQIHDEAMAHK